MEDWFDKITKVGIIVGAAIAFVGIALMIFHCEESLAHIEEILETLAQK